MLISNPLTNSHKISREKSYQRKNDRKVESFTFITKVFAFNFLWVNFFGTFFNGYELSTNLAFYYTHIKFLKKKICYCLLKHFLLTLNPKSDDAAQKNNLSLVASLESKPNVLQKHIFVYLDSVKWPKKHLSLLSLRVNEVLIQFHYEIKLF